METTQPKKRSNLSGNNYAASSRPEPGIDAVEVSQPDIHTVSPDDQDMAFLLSPTNLQSESILRDSDKNLIFEGFADQFFSEFGGTELDAQYGQAYIIPRGELSPEHDIAKTNTQEPTDWLETGSIEAQLDGTGSLHPQALGHSGDMDPYLLQNYQYDLSGAYNFKQLSIQSASRGLVPIQFLLSQPGLFSHSREEMGLRYTSSDVSKEELEGLVPVDTGVRLIALFRRFVLPQYPIFSDFLFPDPQSSPPHLLAAIYMVTQPFAKLDDVLSIELAYETLNNQGLFKLINDALEWGTHNPSLSIVQTMLLLVLRSSTNPLVLESSLKWSLHGALVTACQTLGLHYDPSSWDIAPWQIALRRRVSFTIFSVDKWLASSLGRPPLITRDSWLVTSLTAADGFASSMSSDVWSQYLCCAKLGPLLGDVLSRL